MNATARQFRRSLSRRYPEQPTFRDTTGITKGIVWRHDGFPFMQSILKPGTLGDAAVSHFTISPKDADWFNLTLAFTPGTGGKEVVPGKYVRLHVGGQLKGDPMMSDTPMERRSNWEIRREARGRVLIAGLGLGMILHPILDPRRGSRKFGERPVESLPTVEHVTVVEKNPNVITLVKPSLERYGDRLTIIAADIFEYDPGVTKFDVVYFDIWRDISQDNLPEIAKLHQRWKSRLNRSGPLKPWMSSWQVDTLRSLRAEENRNAWRW